MTPLRQRLSGVEFLRRFVQHVLPKGFVKVRHYGLLANRDRDEQLAVCRRLLAIESFRARLMGTSPPVAGAARAVIAPAANAGSERVCPFCGSRRIECRELPRLVDRPLRIVPEPLDTS
jgi:hypothetical protein